MKNYADERLIKKVQKRLLKQLKKEYRGDGLFVEVEKFEVYMADGPKANLEIRCGRFNNDEANDWQHKIELPITDGNLEFLAGQFYQGMYDWERSIEE